MIRKLLRGPADAVARRALTSTAGVWQARIDGLRRRALFGVGLFAMALPVGGRGGHLQLTDIQLPTSSAARQLSASSALPFFGASKLIAGDAANQLAPITPVHIVGPWVVPSNTWCTWTPDIPGVSGPPYAGTIRWSVNGQFVSPVWGYTGLTPTSNFTLTLEVWAPGGAFLGEEQRTVQVGGAGSC